MGDPNLVLVDPESINMLISASEAAGCHTQTPFGRTQAGYSSLQQIWGLDTRQILLNAALYGETHSSNFMISHKKIWNNLAIIKNSYRALLVHSLHDFKLV